MHRAQIWGCWFQVWSPVDIDLVNRDNKASQCKSLLLYKTRDRSADRKYDIAENINVHVLDLSYSFIQKN